MAVGLDAATFNDAGDASSSAYNHTVSGSDTYLIVYPITGDGGAGTGDSIADSATYNSISMTKGPSAEAGSAQIRVTVLTLVAPSTGENEVAFTVNDTTEHASFAVSYTGVDQSTPIGTAVADDGNSNAPAVTVASATGELVSAAAGTANNSSIFGDDTVIIDDQQYTGNEYMALQEKAGETTCVPSWTTGASRLWVTAGVPLKPAAAVSGRIMGALAGQGGLAGPGGLAGHRGGIAA